MPLQFTDFKNKWLGNVVDYDKTLGYQCVDLEKQYLAEATGKKIGTLGDASKQPSQPAQVLVDTTDVVGDVQAGDIVFKRPNHVGIATGNVTSSSVEILEQNGATGNGLGKTNDRIRTRYILRSDIAQVRRLKAEYLPKKPQGIPDADWAGKNVTLSGSVPEWSFYWPGSELPVKKRNRAGVLKPAKFGGITRKIERMVAANTAEIMTEDYGRVWIYLDKDATVA